MFWLIWIVMMLLTPLFAGIKVWLQTRAESREAANELRGEAQ
jgi:hypothetical protein